MHPMDKRISARAIIIENGKIFLMFRRKNGRSFYAFPGGKKENKESLEECVIRELKEELGILVKPQKLVYEYNSPSSKQYFFLCDYVDGIFGTGRGEEFDKDPATNYYEPRQEYLQKIKNLELKPEEIKLQLLNNLNNKELFDDATPIKILNGQK